MPRTSSRPERTHRKASDGTDVWPVEDERHFKDAVKAWCKLKKTHGGRALSAQNDFIAEWYSLKSRRPRTRAQVASHLQQVRKWHRKRFGQSSRWEDSLDDCLSSSSSPSAYSLPSPLSHVGEIAPADVGYVHTWPHAPSLDFPVTVTDAQLQSYSVAPSLRAAPQTQYTSIQHGWFQQHNAYLNIHAFAQPAPLPATMPPFGFGYAEQELPFHDTMYITNPPFQAL